MSLVASAFVFIAHRSYQRCFASTAEAAGLVMFPQPNIDRRPSFVISPGFGGAEKALNLYRTASSRKLVVSDTSKLVRSWRVSEMVEHSKPASTRRAALIQSSSSEGDDVRSGEALVKRDARTPQERLDSMSLERRSNPYAAAAGAPRQKEHSLMANVVGTANKRPPTARHSLYRRRKRPPFALCMPRHQRPQGCAPLLPMGVSLENQDAVVDHLSSAEIVRAKLSDFKSDLPCVQSGTCPVPAFRCPKGHVWESDGNPVCFYCPVCADSRVTALGRERRQKRDLEVMKKLAEARGGACISKTYAGMHGKMRFRCAEGHEWLSTPANIAYRKTWCPTCADMARSQRKKLDVAEMQHTARQFGGEFLSTEYLGAAVKHQWKCRRGHRFWQTPSNIRRAEGGRRTATFCKKCTAIDRSIIKASVLGGLDPESAKRMDAKLSQIGAMPTRRHFLPRRRKVKRQATTKGGGSDSK